MADYRYNVMHEVDNNEAREIQRILGQLKGHDTCTIIVDHVNERSEDRIQGLIDSDRFEYYTKGINEDDTEFVVKRRE